jgi:hypothetical protein
MIAGAIDGQNKKPSVVTDKSIPFIGICFALFAIADVLELFS